MHIFLSELNYFRFSENLGKFATKNISPHSFITFPRNIVCIFKHQVEVQTQWLLETEV